MKRPQLLLFLLLMFMSFSTVMAQQVSINEAMSRAKSFMQSNTARRAPSANVQTSSQLQLSYTCKSTTSDDVCFYVFNRGTNNGFIIVGGDEVAQEILAYSTTGSFDYTSIPENFKWWLSQYQGQITDAINYAEENPETVSSAKAKAKSAQKVVSKSDINPLINTEWNQTDPYNSAIPSLGEGYTGNYALATGCVATAMAQIMKHFNYPTTGVGSNSYTGINNLTFSADFANTTYDWSNMTNTYGSESTDVEKNAVATLMYHCGVAANMNYGQIVSGGSSATSEKAAAALCNNFRYNNSIRMEYRKYYTDDAWEQMIYNELSNKRPILYSGQSTSGGHAFVCDGYQASDNTYHMNWGWGGAYDCYVTLTGTDAVKPGGSGAGGAGDEAAYDQDQSVIINIIAKEGGLETPHTASLGDNYISLYIGSTSYTSYSYIKSSETTTATLYTSIWNKSISLSSFTMGVRAYDKSTGMVKYWKSRDISNLPASYYYQQTIPLSFDLKDFIYNGTYELQPVCRRTDSTSDEDWTLLNVTPTDQLPTIVVTGAAEPTVTKGDVTNDGNINKDDVDGIKEIIINGNTTGLNKNAADINGDNNVDIEDAVKLIDQLKSK